MSNNSVWIDQSNLKLSISIANGQPYQGSISPNRPAIGIEYDPLVHGGSTTFDGFSSLLVEYNSNLDFGLNDFTIEFWLKLFDNDNEDISGIPIGILGGLELSENTPCVYILDNVVIFGTKIQSIECGSTTDEWNHFAITRNNGTLRTYKDGELISSIEDNLNYTFNSNDLLIGQCHIDSLFYHGLIGPLRMVNGNSLYSSNIIFDLPFVMDVVDNSILVMNHYNIGIVDYSCNVNVKLNSAIRNTILYKYGDGSIQTNPHDTKSSLEGVLNKSLGTLNFTIEFWINNPDITNDRRVILSLGELFEQNSLTICSEQGGKLTLYLDGVLLILSNQNFISGWNHIAITKQDNVFRMFINGINTGTSTKSNVNIFNSKFQISGGYSSFGINTQLDDLRIIRNVVKYVNAFTPPLELDKR